MPYDIHGSYSIKKYNDILLVTVSGSTNVELFHKLEEELETMRLEFGDKRWALIHDFRQWELSTPDFLRAMKEHDASGDLKGRRCDDQILILASAFKKSIFFDHFPGNSEPDVKLVNNLSEALSIIKDLNYCGYAEMEADLSDKMR